MYRGLCMCASWRELQQFKRRDRNFKIEDLHCYPVCVLHVWMCIYVCNVHIHVWECTLQCWSRKFVALPPLLWDYVVACGSILAQGASRVKSGLQRVGWRAGAAGSLGRSAPSATRTAWVNSTRVSTALAKAITHSSVSLLSIYQGTKSSHAAVSSSSISERWLSFLHPPSSVTCCFWCLHFCCLPLQFY